MSRKGKASALANAVFCDCVYHHIPPSLIPHHLVWRHIPPAASSAVCFLGFQQPHVGSRPAMLLGFGLRVACPYLLALSTMHILCLRPTCTSLNPRPYRIRPLLALLRCSIDTTWKKRQTKAIVVDGMLGADVLRRPPRARSTMFEKINTPTILQLPITHPTKP